MSKGKIEFKVGDKFWMITLLEFQGKTARSRPLFKVQCDCGKIIERYSVRSLVSKTAPCKSCGCLRAKMRHGPHPKRRQYSESTKNQCYSLFVKTCRERHNRGFPCDNWSQEQWYNLVSQPCYYCGGIDTRNLAISQRTCSEHYANFPDEEIRKYDLKINSIDRVDSTKGYLFSNAVSCCGRCNKAKLHYTQDEFYDMIVAIYNHRGLHARR